MISNLSIWAADMKTQKKPKGLKFLFYLCPSLNFFNKLLHITTMKTGKVKFFNESKGFGFIVDNESGNELFVHVSGLIDEIKNDDEVTFEVTEGKKGLNAINVKIA